MSRFLSTMLVVVGICCVCCSDFGPYTKVRAATPAEKDRVSAPTRVALVDMGSVVKRFAMFEQKREPLKLKIKDADEIGRKMLKELQQAAQKLQTLEIGSEERKSLEAQVKKQQAEFEEYRKVKAAEFQKEEVQIYRDIYVIIANAVADYAKEHEIDLVMRTNSEDLMADKDPAQMFMSLNRPIVYQNNLDITDAIVDAVNHP